MASSSSSSACPPNHRPWKHSVFLSFSGEDVRSNFISHLYEALSEISSDVFIDYRLEPAKEIAPTLMKAIEESMIAVVVFSKRYASSTWCLDELERIIDCCKIPGKLDVIPVFYHVDASHVHDPTVKGGIYAEDFARHEESFKERLTHAQELKKALTRKSHLVAAIFIKALEKHEEDFNKKVSQVQRWKDAMTKAANFKGWDSKAKDISSDAKLVKKIVDHVKQKLVQGSPTNLEGLVGINSRIEQTKKKLSLESNDVRLLGIWGMGGIGKTTLAKALFKQIWFEFEASCILENVRPELGKAGGLGRLREELLLKILGKKIMMPNIDHTHLLQDILSRKKVLVVLDDLTSVKQLKLLIGYTSWFGAGSRIIVTSRNKEIIGKNGLLGERVQVIDPYEVKRLKYSDSFKLFSENAFEKKDCTDDYLELSTCFVKFCRGVPLALEVLGRHLLGRDKDGWKISLSNLEKGPHEDVYSILKLSYDDLCRDGQEMFLDIACFLCGEGFNVVETIFERCDYSIKINDLVEKCLVTLSDKRVWMHHLLQEMGRKIERQKFKCPSKRTRLWDYKDIRKVFSRKIVCESIESISLDMSRTTQVLKLDSQAFARLPNLKFLSFYNSYRDRGYNKVYLPEGLECLPDDLLYFCWYGCPLKFLPANFNATDLVVLELPYSSLEQMWECNKELEIRSPSQAPINSRSMITYHSTMVNKVPSPMRYLSQLSKINLSFSQNIKIFPSTVDLKYLLSLNLRGCTQLLEFPEVPSNIIHLFLESTAIEDVPFWVGDLDNLLLLSMSTSPKLRNVPLNIFLGKAAHHTMKLDGSPNVKFTFSEINDCLPDDPTRSSTQDLDLSRTNIESLPDEFSQLHGLQNLDMNYCEQLRSLPKLPRALKGLHAENCTSLEAISNLKQLLDTEDIDLINAMAFSFANCLKVDESSWSDLIPSVILRIQKMAKEAKEYHLIVEPYFRIIYPGNRISERFICSDEGIPFVTMELRPNWYTSNFLGFILFAVFEERVHNTKDFRPVFIHCECEFENNEGGYKSIMCCNAFCLSSPILLSEHVALWYNYNLCVEMEKTRDWFCQSDSYKASFHFMIMRGKSSKAMEIKKCGVLPIYGLGEGSNNATVPSMRKNRTVGEVEIYYHGKYLSCHYPGLSRINVKLDEDDEQEEEDSVGESESEISDKSDWDDDDEQEEEQEKIEHLYF